MKNFLLPALLIFTISCGSSNKTVIKPSPELTDFQNTITEEGLFVDLAILASDSLEGRDTGSEGERKAAEYLSNRYKELGLLPVGDNNSFFQNYELTQSIFDSIQFEVYLGDVLIDKSTHSSSKIGSFTKIEGGESDLEGGIVFIGYGDLLIENSSSDLNLDINGKWLLSFYDYSVLNIEDLQNYVASENALGLIFISNLNQEYFEEEAFILQGEFGNPSRLELPHLKSNEGATINISPELAAQLLELRSIDELVQFESEVRQNKNGFSPYEINATFRYVPAITELKTQTRNVVAVIEGTDPNLKNEVVVLSAHYDHVGIGNPDANGDSIYNGADDDGSGTVGLLHTAQAFATAKSAGANLKRSVMFLHVSGEERGLFGSRYYSDHPIYSVENTVANLNVDMIGRRDAENIDNPDYVYIIGGKIISTGLQDVLEQANEMSVNIELSDRYNDLNDPEQFYRRSDHWNFGRLGIPFIFYFNGTHEDYHRPSDEIEKIDFEALKKRTQLLYMTASLLSNSDIRPEVDNQDFIELSNQ